MNTATRQQLKQPINDGHEEKRQAIYQTIPSFWHDLWDEPYALYDIKLFSTKEAEEIRQVTKKIGCIYDKTAHLLRQLPDETFVALGISEKAIPFLRQKALPTEGVIRRIDLVKTKTGWKHYEINSDTPTFIKELHHVNGVLATHFGYKDVNEGCEEQLSKAINQAIYHIHQKEHFPKIVFTAHHDHEEDWQTTKYLADLSKLPHEVVPIEQLILQEGIGLFTPSGEQIDVLYRQTYPIEHLVEDTSEDETAIGVALLRLVQEEKLAIINPLSAYLLQSKAVQALIWGLYEEKNAYFTIEEHAWIEAHFIPTYLECDAFVERQERFVEKPSFGREGDTILIYDEKGHIETDNGHRTYEDSLKVYQQYTELPKQTVMTPYGETEGYLLVGSFLIGEEPGAFGIRIGEKVTGNESCFLPAGLH